MDELTLTGLVRRGSSGPDVKRVQEWLSLNGHGVEIDSSFGAATEVAVKAFQAAHGLQVDGVVGNATFTKLTEPMRKALAPIAPQGRSLGALTVAYAQQHLAQKPREVGGDNCGPWVRLYMNGHDGAEWRWCAGFACFCLNQACEALKVAPPIKFSFSCDELAASAKQKGLFVQGNNAKVSVPPGSLFLVCGAPGDWKHTGIVVASNAETFSTIEGNTNDGGSANGYEVTARTRSWSNRDFIRIN